jgi:hypothetical protein
MSETKFTPGPWFTGIDSATGQMSRVRASHKGGRDNVCVAEIPVAKDSAEREANAQLISAAPDMYAVLTWLNQQGGLGYESHEAIGSVLRKARGEA